MFGFLIVGETIEHEPFDFPDPPENPNSPDKNLYDSVTANDKSDSIIVYTKDRFYPLYIISYT